MRLPTKKEVQDFIGIVNKGKEKPKTQLGMMRVAAKYFHCTIKDLENILK